MTHGDWQLCDDEFCSSIAENKSSFAVICCRPWLGSRSVTSRSRHRSNAGTYRQLTTSLVGFNSPDRIRYVRRAVLNQIQRLIAGQDWLEDAAQRAENETVMASYYATDPKRRMVLDRATMVWAGQSTHIASSVPDQPGQSDKRRQ